MNEKKKTVEKSETATESESESENGLIYNSALKERKESISLNGCWMRHKKNEAISLKEAYWITSNLLLLK